MKTYKFETTVEISEQRISDMLTTALEGGSGYWLTMYAPDIIEESKKFCGEQNVEKLILAGGSIKVYDAESEKCDEENRLGDLNMLNIITALEAMAKGENAEGRKNDHLKTHFNNFISENDDAITADVIVQIAVMRKIVYG